MQQDNNSQEATKDKTNKLLIIIVATILSFHLFFSQDKQTEDLSNNTINYTQFLDKVKSNKIQKVTLTENRFGPKTIVAEDYDKSKFLVKAPNDANLVSTLVDHNVSVEATPEPTPNFLTQLFLSLLPTILFLGVFFLIMKRLQGGKNGGIFSFNKSKATLIAPEQIEQGFDDVIGCDSAKFEMEEMVDILKNPEKYENLGGSIPKGVLLTGHSGTGKTMLAKALAKESGVPFFATSGSSFVEMIVGVGAGRVRSMFEEAKKHAPCIIFIDEIDALGKRNSGQNFSNDEKEQTLNQLLVELDGIASAKGIILVGATNRPEMLDPALLRPGRIDRQIRVELPDINGRWKILQLYAKKRPIGEDVNLRKIAYGTPGFSGADLANLMNEASLLAARKNQKVISHQDLENAKDKIMLGLERPDLVMTENDKKDTAYHETGHAIVAKVVKHSFPLHKVSIMPRGRALGVTIQIPEKEPLTYKKEQLIDQICIIMGGRAAEEVFCNTLTNGAADDISKATDIAQNMVMRWGMSELGPIAVGKQGGSEFNGAGYIDFRGTSPELINKAETLVQELLNSQYQRAKEILIQHREECETMTALLMLKEVISGEEAEAIMKKEITLKDIAPQLPVSISA